MTCFNIQKLLHEYIDNELDQFQQAEIADHLDQCSECHEAWVELNGLKNLLGQIKTQQPSESYWEETTRLIMAKTVDLDENIIPVISLHEEETDKKTAFRRSLLSVAASIALLLVSIGLNSSSLTTKFAQNQPEALVFTTYELNQRFDLKSHMTDDQLAKFALIDNSLSMGFPGLPGGLIITVTGDDIN